MRSRRIPQARGGAPQALQSIHYYVAPPDFVRPQHGRTRMSATGRPEREYRSAQRKGSPMSAKGRPERELLPLWGQRSGNSRERGGGS